MKTKSIPPSFSFYGGKHKHAKRYPEPKYGRIIEPFAGSAGYSHRHPDNDVTLIERDPTIASVWRYLIGASAADIRALPLLGPDDDLRDMRSLSDAERALLGFWVNGGCTSPFHRFSKWARNNPPHWSNFWGRACRERLATNVERVNHWKIIEGSYVDAPDVAATWFIDPPYQQAGKRYRYGSDTIDYAELGEWCRSRRGQVIVCENDGAEWLPFVPLYSIPGAVVKTRRTVEAVWFGGEHWFGFGGEQ